MYPYTYMHPFVNRYTHLSIYHFVHIPICPYTHMHPFVHIPICTRLSIYLYVVPMYLYAFLIRLWVRSTKPLCLMIATLNPPPSAPYIRPSAWPCSDLTFYIVRSNIIHTMYIRRMCVSSLHLHKAFLNQWLAIIYDQIGQNIARQHCCITCPGWLASWDQYCKTVAVGSGKLGRMKQWFYCLFRDP